jgi:hypothetical protein
MVFHFSAAAHVAWSLSVQTATYLCVILSAAPSSGARVPPVPLNSKWFQSYSRALLEDDLAVALIYVKKALDIINETLKQPHLEESERQAILMAVRYLRLIENQELQKAS